MVSRSPLFRKQALEYYARNSEKTILPRLVRPPVFLLLWLLLGLIGLAFMLAWLSRIPVYASGPGMIIEQSVMQQQHVVQATVALVILPVASGHLLPVRPGTPVQIQIGTGAQEQQFTSVVSSVMPDVLGPDQIEQRYQPGSSLVSLIRGPSMVILLKLDQPFASQAYAGSLINAQIQIGSTSVLSLVFGSAQPVGE